MKRKKRTIQTADMYAITTIAIIAVPCNFNASRDTLRIATLDTLKNDTLKTEILDSATLVTHKSRDALFARNKAVGLLNTQKKSKRIRKRSIDVNTAVPLIGMLPNGLPNMKAPKTTMILMTFRPLYSILKKIPNTLSTSCRQQLRS